MGKKIDYETWYHEESAENEKMRDYLRDLDLDYVDGLQAYEKVAKRYDELWDKFAELESVIFDDEINCTKGKVSYIVTFDFNKDKVVKAVKNEKRR